MADTFSGMTADRIRGAIKTRLKQLYIDQGYDPSLAETMANAELARRERQAMIDRPEPGYTGESGRMLERDIYRSNPRRLGLDQPAPEMDQFRETRVTRDDARNYTPVRPSSAPPVRREMVDVPDELPLTPGRIGQFVLGQAPSTRMEQTVPNAEAEAERQAERPPLPWYRNIFGSNIPVLPDFSLSPMGAQRTPYFEQRARENASEISRELGQQPGYVRPSESGSTATNRLIDRAVSTITGTPPAAAQPARQTINGQPVPSEDATENAPRMLGGDYNDVFNAPYTPPAKAAIRTARAATAPARQDSAPAAAPTQGGGFFSNMFKDPYAGKSSRDLYEMYNQDRDNGSLYFRAAAKQAQERKDAGTPVAEEGMKRGGAAGSPAGGHHKDAAIMKALEIIHHMLRRG